MEELERMESLGLITKTEEATPCILVVPKPNGTARISVFWMVVIFKLKYLGIVGIVSMGKRLSTFNRESYHTLYNALCPVL